MKTKNQNPKHKYSKTWMLCPRTLDKALSEIGKSIRPTSIGDVQAWNAGVSAAIDAVKNLKLKA